MTFMKKLRLLFGRVTPEELAWEDVVDLRRIAQELQEIKAHLAMLSATDPIVPDNVLSRLGDASSSISVAGGALRIRLCDFDKDRFSGKRFA